VPPAAGREERVRWSLARPLRPQAQAQQTASGGLRDGPGLPAQMALDLVPPSSGRDHLLQVAAGQLGSDLGVDHGVSPPSRSIVV